MKTAEQRRIWELEILTNSLMRERKLNGEINNLKEVLDGREQRIEKLEGERKTLQKNLKDLQFLSDNHVTQTNKTIDMLVRERDDFRQEMSDLHDFMIDQSIHECDGIPGGCPVKNLLYNNPKRGK